MVRTLQIFTICVVLVGVARGQVVAEDTWTSSLGRYTRILAVERRLRAEYASLPQNGVLLTTNDQSDGRYSWSNYRRRLRDHYVEIGREYDVRYMQNRIASLTNNPFPRFGYNPRYINTPSLFVDHQRMELTLLGREVSRQHYIRNWRPYGRSGSWYRGYTGIPYFRVH